MFGGESGNLKTFTSLYIALCLCTGKKVFGEFDTKKCKVLYVDCENRDIVIKERVESIIQGYDMNVSDIEMNFSFFPDLKLDNERSVNLFMEFVDWISPDVIICDSLVRMMEGSENDAKEVRKIFDNIKQSLNEGISWFILHHTRKSNGNASKDDLRGSGDLAGMADVLIMIRRTGIDRFTIAQPKNRLNKELNKFSFNFGCSDYNGAIFDFDKWHTDSFVEKIPKSLERAKVIQGWIEKNNITSFRTKDVLDISEDSKDWGMNPRTDALKEAVEMGIIKKGIKMGDWVVC